MMLLRGDPPTPPRHAPGLAVGIPLSKREPKDNLWLSGGLCRVRRAGAKI